MNDQFLAAVKRMVEQGGARRLPGGGFDLRDEIAGDTGAGLPSVSGLFVTPGPTSKQWILHWNGISRASGYELQTNQDPAHVWGWSEPIQVEETSAMVRQHPTAARLWMRVRAVNMWHRGPWSDPVCNQSVEFLSEEEKIPG